MHIYALYMSSYIYHVIYAYVYVYILYIYILWGYRAEEDNVADDKVEDADSLCPAGPNDSDFTIVLLRAQVPCFQIHKQQANK
jgi:hypothetical protein